MACGFSTQCPQPSTPPLELPEQVVSGRAARLCRSAIGACSGSWLRGTSPRSKQSNFRCHLDPAFGRLPLDKIGVEQINRFKAELLARDLSKKCINNILTVLSRALRYAQEAEVIERVPRTGIYKVERPEIQSWDFEQYARLVEAAKRDERTCTSPLVWPVRPGSAAARSWRFAGARMSTWSPVPSR